MQANSQKSQIVWDVLGWVRLHKPHWSDWIAYYSHDERVSLKRSWPLCTLVSSLLGGEVEFRAGKTHVENWLLFVVLPGVWMSLECYCWSLTATLGTWRKIWPGRCTRPSGRWRSRSCRRTSRRCARSCCCWWEDAHLQFNTFTLLLSPFNPQQVLFALNVSPTIFLLVQERFGMKKKAHSSISHNATW